MKSLLVASTAMAGGGWGYGGYRGGYGWGWGPAAAIGALAVGAAALTYGGPYYYGYAPGYYYAQQPVYYAPQTVVYNAQPEVVYSSPTVNYEPQRPAQPPAPSVQQQPAQPNNQKQSMTVAEIKALVKGGLSDDIILSQVRSQHAVFHLTTDEILDLNTNKVSQKVIEFMINTASTR